MLGETARAQVDPDVDFHVAAVRDETLVRRWDIGLAIAIGGAVGAVARYGLSLGLPTSPGGFPWSTFTTNVTGCLLIGVLMVILTEVQAHPHRLARPFLAVGVLGGFTTFSTYTAEARELIVSGAPPGLGLGYLFATLAAALVAVQVATVLTRVVTTTLRSGGRQ